MKLCRNRVAAQSAGSSERACGGDDFDLVTSEMNPEISLGSANAMIAMLHAHTVTTVGQKNQNR